MHLACILGADAIIVQEALAQVADVIWFTRCLKLGQNIRLQGCDIQAGMPILPMGGILNPRNFSVRVAGLAQANGLSLLPADTSYLNAGDDVRFLLFDIA